MSSLGARKNLYGDLILPPRTHTWQSPTHHMIWWACVLFAEFCNEKAFASSQLFLPKSKHRHSQELLDAWPQFILLQLKPVLSCSSTGRKVPSFSPVNLCHLQGHPSPGAPGCLSVCSLALSAATLRPSSYHRTPKWLRVPLPLQLG